MADLRDVAFVALASVAAIYLCIDAEPAAPENTPPARRDMVGPGTMPADTPFRAPSAPPPRRGADTVDFSLLSYYDYDPEADVIPEGVLALDGKKIELIGVMYYGVEDPDRVTEFYLMPNHMVCCYGTYRINEAVKVTLKAGLRTQYVLNYYNIRGTLRVGAVRDDEDRVECLYHITAAEAEVME